MFRIRLKELRESRELSQQSFADSFGVAQSTVGGWEAGKREPNFETTIRIAKYFNVSVDYLLGVENAPIQRAGCLYDSSAASNLEQKIIGAYRNADERDRWSVLRILNISDDEHKTGKIVAG